MEFIKHHPEGFLLTVTVQPRSSRNQIVAILNDTLKIKLTAAPVDNAANKMCIQYLAKCLGLPKSAIEIVAGHTGRRKQLLIRPKLETDPATQLAALKDTILAMANGK